MKIVHNFPGANIDIVEISEKEVLLKTDVRDSMQWWFHWAFAVEDALGEITFRFIDDETIGYYGPAVSYDRVNWNWLGENSRIDGKTFVYEFKSKKRIYFAFSMLYQVGDFNRFNQGLDKYKCTKQTLTISKQGREVPLLKIGDSNAENHILLSARHHACESTGSYVLEGVIDEFAKNPIPNYLVYVIPFVDIDGVENGDQGKARAPHDHNRDYINSPIYPETKAWMEYSKDLNIKIVIDFHSPGRWAGDNDHICFVKKFGADDWMDEFSDILELETADSNYRYDKQNNYLSSRYMKEGEEFTSCAGFFGKKPGVKMATTAEIPYFGIDDHITTQENMRQFGKAIAISLRKLIKKY